VPNGCRSRNGPNIEGILLGAPLFCMLMGPKLGPWPEVGPR